MNASVNIKVSDVSNTDKVAISRTDLIHLLGFAERLDEAFQEFAALFRNLNQDAKKDSQGEIISRIGLIHAYNWSDDCTKESDVIDRLYAQMGEGNAA